MNLDLYHIEPTPASHSNGHAKNTTLQIDSVEIRRALRILTDPGQVIELRILGATTKEAPRYAYQASGYFNEAEKLITALSVLRGARGVYLTLQPCQPALLARAHNRLRTSDEMRKAAATADAHITAYRWLLIDIDPERPADISSSADEHQAALAHAAAIRHILGEEGWPEPVLADSGNGAHLQYRIDLPAGDADLVQRVLKSLATRFDVEGLHIDQTVYNPARISKLYGTLACKGDHTEDRPHRMSRILQVPDEVQAVPRELLETQAVPVAAPSGSEARRSSGRQPERDFDLAEWIREHHVDVVGPRDWHGGQKWIFPVCPWNAEHTDHSAYLIKQPGGAIAAGCQHNGCRDNGWRQLRTLYEPEAYTIKGRTPPPSGKQASQATRDSGRPTSSTTTRLEQALAEKQVLTLFEEVATLAKISRADYLSYKHRIKDTFGHEVNLNDLDAAVKEARRAAEEDEDTKAKVSQADVIVNLAEQEATFFASPGGICYGRVPVREHYETYPIHERGGMFRLWLLKRYRDETGSTPNETALSAAMQTLTANAMYSDAERRDVFIRLGHQGGKVYLDLANRAHQLVEVDGHGWRVLTESPICFRRYNGIGELPVPEHGGTLALLDPFLNADEDHRILAKAWVIGCLHPFGPYPTLGIHGERGSAKTTTAKVLRSLVDPCVALLRSTPKDVQALTIAAANNHIIGLDNLSAMPGWLSDALCRTATGAGDAYRQLYTDADEVVFSYTKPIIFTGIEEIGTRGDFLDRCLLLTLPAIDNATRKEERVFWREFRQVHPLILGALLDAVSMALRTYGQVRLPGKPRMADFATWVTACEELITPGVKPERSFLELYLENREAAVEIEVEASLVGTAVKAFMDNWPGGTWAGKAEDLLKALNDQAPLEAKYSRNWPKNGRALSGRLKRLATSLRSMGLHVTWDRARKERTLLLQKVEPGGGDANEGGDAKVTQIKCVCVTPSDGPRSDSKGSVTQGDANSPFLSSFVEPTLKEEKEKEERREREGGERGDRERGKFASPASPSAATPPVEGTEVVTQTEKICVTFASPPSFASPGHSLEDVHTIAGQCSLSSNGQTQAVPVASVLEASPRQSEEPTQSGVDQKADGFSPSEPPVTGNQEREVFLI